jgi:hypothetical protein
METPKSSSSIMNADGSTTPRPSRNERNFDALLDIPPPPYNGHGHGTATETSSLLSYDSFYDDPRSQIRHVAPSPDNDSQFTDDEGGSVATVRRYSSQSASASTRSGASEGGWRDIDLNEWLPCISVWLLAMMVVMVVSGAAAVMYLLVTQ